MEIGQDWAKILAAAAAGEPGTIKGQLFSEDKSHRYKQLAEMIATFERDCPSPRLAIDGWLNRMDLKRQVLPESSMHDFKWAGSLEIPAGNFELHVTRAR